MLLPDLHYINTKSGKGNMTDEQLIHFSKLISYTIRHNPKQFGLELADDGSVAVEKLISGFNEKSKYKCTVKDVEAVMSMPGKKRFAIENGRIRAYYGHSIEKEIKKESAEPPTVLYHATTHKALPLILKDGLKPMNRQHVHLASTKETALMNGRRREPYPPLLQINAKKAYEDGIAFFLGNEDIWLSDPIPAKYISIVDQLKICW